MNTLPSFEIGNLVLFHGKCAVIQSQFVGKFTIAIEGGDEKNVRSKDIQFLHPGPVKKLPLPPAPNSPDLAEISQLIAGETVCFPDFAELCFGEYSPTAAYAAFKILADDLYFTGSVGEGVRANPLEAVEGKLQRLREKAEAKERYSALVERIRTNAILPEDFPAMGEIKAVALGQSDSSKLLKSLGIEAVPERAHQLLLDLKVWSHADNPFPARFGVDMDDPDIPPLVDDGCPVDGVARRDFTDWDSYAIDDAGSDDPDDAIGVHDGLFWVHIADPTDAVPLNSEVDLEARRRAVNSYLPEKVSHMFPRWVTQRFALGLNGPTPAISFGMDFDGETGEPELRQICLSTVKVTRLTYDSNVLALAIPEYQQMYTLMQAFRNYRKKNGAVFIRLPEVKISVDEQTVVSISKTPFSPIRELVANAMIATGFAVAKWAVANGVTIPFVSQEGMREDGEKIGQDSPILDESDDAPRLSEMFQLRSVSKPGKIGMEPKTHSGLGLSCYTRVTSPLRRYVDFLTIHQLRRYLLNQEMIDYHTIDSIVSALEEPMNAAKYLERYCREYWTLVWMTQQPKDRVLEAVPVKRMFGDWIFILPEIGYQYRCKIRGGIVRDLPVSMRVCGANPVSLQARMAIVPKEQLSADAEVPKIEEVELGDTINKDWLQD